MRCTPEVSEFWSLYLPVGREFFVSPGNRLFIGKICTYLENDINGVVARTKSILDSIIDNINVKSTDCCVLIHSPTLSLLKIRKGILEQLGFPDESAYRRALIIDPTTSLVFVNELLQTKQNFIKLNLHSKLFNLLSNFLSDKKTFVFKCSKNYRKTFLKSTENFSISAFSINNDEYNNKI